MSAGRSKQSTEKKQEQSPHGLVLVSEHKEPTRIWEVERQYDRPFAFVNGLRVGGIKYTEVYFTKMILQGGYYFIDGEKYDFKKCEKRDIWLLKIIPVSASSFGLVYGKRNEACETHFSEYATTVTVIDVRTRKEISEFKLPVFRDTQIRNLIIKTFRRNTNYFVYAFYDLCWLYNSESKQWKPILNKKADCIIYGLIIFDNNDLGIISADEKYTKMSLSIYKIDFEAHEFKLKRVISSTESIINIRHESTNSNKEISPVSNFYFIIGKQLFRIVDDNIIYIPTKSDKLISLNWLPDGSLIARSITNNLYQIYIVGGNKIEFVDLHQKADDLYVHPDGRLQVIYNGNSLLFDVQSVLSAQNKRPDEKSLNVIDARLLLILQSTISLDARALRIILEYSAEDPITQLVKSKEMTIPRLLDMKIELVDAIKQYYEMLEMDVLILSKKRHHFFDSFEDKAKLKVALDFIISLLVPSKSFSECLMEALTSSFKKEILVLGKCIPELGVEIDKIMPRPKDPRVKTTL